ncbi:hypothetical protein [Streptomyces sp. NBC_00582]|uniref:hypothetical protein n=1 Tax=Streptomyces sp. NBC_00582 TaxID=2975783 RepID=UPI0010D6C7B6|nr:hypothetical protein [Streptomyces sp. NBC_00582]
MSSNDGAFSAEYTATRSTPPTELAATVALGILLLAVLGGLQWYLACRFRRILNPGVLAATVCTLLAVLLGAQMLSASAEHLRGARRDALDSVVALSRARAIASDANADESRYLLDPGRRDRYARWFLAKSQQLYGLKGATLSTYDAALATTWQAYESDDHDLRITGEFRRELDNITFPGERAAARRYTPRRARGPRGAPVCPWSCRPPGGAAPWAVRSPPTSVRSWPRSRRPSPMPDGARPTRSSAGSVSGCCE